MVVEIEETEATADGTAGSFLGVAYPKGQRIGLPLFTRFEPCCFG